MKRCGKCKQDKDESCFYKRNNYANLVGQIGYSTDCKECTREARRRDRDVAITNPRRPKCGRSGELLRGYGITLADYNSMLLSQDGKCLVCKREGNGHDGKKHLCVDHDHKTGQVRGLLCSQCNHAVGLFQDNPDMCMSAANYLNSCLPNLT